MDFFPNSIPFHCFLFSILFLYDHHRKTRQNLEESISKTRYLLLQPSSPPVNNSQYGPDISDYKYTTFSVAQRYFAIIICREVIHYSWLLSIYLVSSTYYTQNTYQYIVLSLDQTDQILDRYVHELKENSVITLDIYPTSNQYREITMLQAASCKYN